MTGNGAIVYLAVGDDCLRVTGPDTARLRQLGHALRASGRFSEVVDGTASVSVLFDPLRYDVHQTKRTVGEYLLSPFSETRQDRMECTLQIRFGGESGPDLDEVCAALRLTQKAFTERLTGLSLSVDMLGFVPGFAYIKGLPEDMIVPRMTTPRQTVRAGSLGIAAGQIGTYALEGPGGWPIIGHVQNQLFSPGAEDPFLLKPGMRVILKDITSL